MPVQNKTMIDAGLKKIGFGGLDDPTLFDQIAFVISGKGEKEGHCRFKSLLLSAEPDKRLIAYQAIAPKLRFKAFPLEDYIRQGHEDADKLHLPTYNRETLAIDEWHQQEIETQEFKQTKLERFAQKAIAKDLREENAKGQLVLVCRKCTREQKWRGSNKPEMTKLARLEGWSVKDEVICPACKKSRVV